MSLSLQVTTTEGVAKADVSSTKRLSRRNRAKDLKKEENQIMSQEDDSDMELGMSRENSAPLTPSTTKYFNSSLNIDANSQSPNVVKNARLAQTPRRSTRKSVKPVQEYEDIVSRKRQLRSATTKLDDEKNQEPEEETQTKWTPAKVGRVSQKRSRKSRRTVGADKNKTKILSSSENEDNEICNDKQNEDTPLIESDMTKLDQTNISIKKEETVKSVQQADKKNENPLNESQIIKMEQTNVALEDGQIVIIDQVEQEECDLATDLGNQHVDNEYNTITKGDNTETIKVHTVNELQDEIETTSQNVNITKVTLNITQENCTAESKIVMGEDKKGFGTYLKKNNILDVSDLGLNPLTEGAIESEEDKTVNDKRELSSNDKDFPIVTLNDDTFNDSDCILLNTGETKNVEDDMQPLRLSDDESGLSPPRKSPRIIITTHEGEQQLLNLSVPIVQEGTPKRYSKTALRKPTPFKPNTENSHEDDEIIADESKCDVGAVTITVSKMEPKEIVLRSIRKRSWSVCIGGAEADNRRKNVTFYSPANQTTILEDLDMRIVRSVKKNNTATLRGAETFVTQRRKRSLSFDEATMIKKSKSPSHPSSKMRITPNAKPQRTKLPNFAAIHQKNFEKMENLVDHVNRKVERAKILTNSATKNRIASAQKAVQHSSTVAITEKPKAVKRINLHNSVNTTFSENSESSQMMAADVPRKYHNDSKLPIPQIALLKPMPSTETAYKENHALKLPNPRLGIIKPHTITIASNKTKQPTPAKNAFKPILSRQPLRPAFNLSTALESSHVNNAKSANIIGVPANNAATSKTNAITTTNAPTVSFDEKMASRRQRRMDMFKGRGVTNARTTPSTAEKNYSHLIRGVRSNRRFELQMAHRKNMEH